MKKRIRLIVMGAAVFCLSPGVLAQHSYMSLSLGGSFPRGSFAEATDPGVNGFAGSSFTMAFDGNYFFGNLGITGTLNFGMSYLDDQMLKEARIADLKEIYIQPIIPPDATVDFITTQWSYVHLMTGPVFSLSAPVVSFEMKAMGGASFVMPPQQNLTITAGGNTWTSTASGQSIRFGYLTGAAVLIHPNPGYGIRLGVDYIATTVSYKVHYNHDEGVVTDNQKVEVETLAVRLIHATVGIFYNF